MNVQTLPHGGDGLAVKRAFAPKLDCFLFADYPNIELKILGYYLESVGHPSMADVFRQGADLHQVTADGIGADRQVGKKLNFSIVYGGGMPTLMRQLNITAKEALDLLRAYHATWPGIGWASKRKEPDAGTLGWSIGRRLEQRGYITTLYGRHLRPHSPHVRINALCQGCAADLMKWALVRIYQGLELMTFDSHIVACVHDEVGLDCPFIEIPLLRELVPDWMTDDRIEAVVPIRPTCDLAWPTWGEKGKWEEVYGTWNVNAVAESKRTSTVGNPADSYTDTIGPSTEGRGDTPTPLPTALGTR